MDKIYELNVSGLIDYVNLLPKIYQLFRHNFIRDLANKILELFLIHSYSHIIHILLMMSSKGFVQYSIYTVMYSWTMCYIHSRFQSIGTGNGRKKLRYIGMHYSSRQAMHYVVSCFLLAGILTRATFATNLSCYISTIIIHNILRSFCARFIFHTFYGWMFWSSKLQIKIHD